MIWKKSKRSAFEAFSDGVKAGYRAGYDDGYQQALDDLREALRNGKAVSAEEDHD